MFHPLAAIADPGSGIVCTLRCPSSESIGALLVHKELIRMVRSMETVIRSRLVRGKDLAIKARSKLRCPRHGLVLVALIQNSK